MKKLFAAIALVTLPLLAAAHGPTPQKVEKTVTISAPPAKVWAIVKDFGGMQKWHPAVVSTKLENKNDPDGKPTTYRTLNLKGGGTIVEYLSYAKDDEMKIKYYMTTDTALPVTDYVGTMQVKAGATANESVVTWVGRFYRKYTLNPPIPAGQDDASAVAAVTGVFDAGLPSLKKVAEGK